MVKTPRVSIITPCYDVAPYVERMIESVRHQTFTEWEHILVDDGSTDDTAAVVERAIANEPRARLIRQSNAGVCAARNVGYAASSSACDYVYFPDSDDLLEPNLIETMVQYLDVRPHVTMAFCAYQLIDVNDEPLPTDPGARYVPFGLGVRALSDDEPGTPFESLYCWAPVPEPVAFMRRSVFEQTTKWDESFGQHGEGVILFPQFALYGEVHFVPKPLYLYRVRPGQSSRVAGRQERAEQRVVDWWRRADWLTDEQRNIVQRAEWFRYYRLDPWKGIRAADRYFHEGRVKVALRFTFGAIRRYLLSFFTEPGFRNVR